MRKTNLTQEIELANWKGTIPSDKMLYVPSYKYSQMYYYICDGSEIRRTDSDILSVVCAEFEHLEMQMLDDLAAREGEYDQLIDNNEPSFVHDPFYQLAKMFHLSDRTEDRLNIRITPPKSAKVKRFDEDAVYYIQAAKINDRLIFFGTVDNHVIVNLRTGKVTKFVHPEQIYDLCDYVPTREIKACDSFHTIIKLLSDDKSVDYEERYESMEPADHCRRLR